MEDYNQQLSDNVATASRGGSTSFLYGSPVLANPTSSSVYARTTSSSDTHHHHHHQINNFHIQSNDCFQSEAQPHPIVKIEMGSSQHPHKFHYPSIIRGHQGMNHHQQAGAAADQQRQDSNNNINESSNEDEAMKAKIIAHPQYSNLLQAYMDCQKVGAPPEVVARLSAVRQEFEARQQRASSASRDLSKDPELDQFMEAYYDMLVKYRDELTRPLQEAMEYMRRIEAQLNMLTTTGAAPLRVFTSEQAISSMCTIDISNLLGLKGDGGQYSVMRGMIDEKCEGIGSSEEDQDNSGGETELPEIDPRAEDRELKNHLLRKYSGYLSSLKQELSKKKKKGKLPKDARQKLLNWWELHYKWPYPSETEKVALAESTGLDQKQINNWFINQRKRHWKPSEDMQFMVMDGLHPQNAALYMEGHYMGEGPYRLGP
ncbi:hypothetical protein LguiA_006528 [Lonicera macranthoides]